MSTLSVDRSASRHYGDEAGRYWSVSQVCEVVYGERKYADQGAMQRGTDVHEIFALELGAHMGWCEHPVIAEDYAGYHVGILAWIKQAKPQPMMLERTLKHKTYPYAGTLDYVGMIGEDYGVLDLKTGTPERWHTLQIHGYQKMLDKASRMWVLYLSNDGSFKQIPVKPSARDWAAFQNGLSILQWREG